MKTKKIWYVIADGGRARFVECDERGAFRTITTFVSPDLHSKSSELGRDRPARVMESATLRRSAVEPRRDPKTAAKEEFVELVAEQLKAEYERSKFGGLVLVAPPGVLTQLKSNLGRTLAELVTAELQKDLTKVPDQDLASHLAPAS